MVEGRCSRAVRHNHAGVRWGCGCPAVGLAGVVCCLFVVCVFVCFSTSWFSAGCLCFMHRVLCIVFSASCFLSAKALHTLVVGGAPSLGGGVGAPQHLK